MQHLIEVAKLERATDGIAVRHLEARSTQHERSDRGHLARKGSRVYSRKGPALSGAYRLNTHNVCIRELGSNSAMEMSAVKDLT